MSATLAAIIVDVIISTIMLGQSVDSMASNAIGTKNQAEIKAWAERLSKEILSDQKMINLLLPALERRNNKLASQILTSSPYGTRIAKLKEKYYSNEREINRKQAELENLNTEYANLQSDAEAQLTKATPSGSWIGDRINQVGSAAKPELYERKVDKRNVQTKHRLQTK